MIERRKDNKGRVLKEGETQRKDGCYDYRWRTADGRRHSVYAKTLEELREKQKKIQRDKSDGIRAEAKNVTLNDVFDLWVELKKGIKDNTFQNYQYMYNQFVYSDFGKSRVLNLKRSDVRRFYNLLADERYIKIRTIECIHTVMFQVLNLAVEEDYLRMNPATNAMKELKLAHNFNTEKRKALTIKEHEIFMNSLNTNKECSRWKPVFTIMINTGLRVGELTGLRWDDFENNTINVNHTLVYYNHRTNGCYFNINTPKTKSGYRTIPMIAEVRKAFLEEKQYQEASGVPQDIKIDDIQTSFSLISFGNVQNQVMLNKALRRIMRDCNDTILENTKASEEPVLLPRFSCHTLRHTFATHMCESGINIKVIQDVLGHAGITTTMNIYTDATKELKENEFVKFNDFIRISKQKV